MRLKSSPHVDRLLDGGGDLLGVALLTRRAKPQVLPNLGPVRQPSGNYVSEMMKNGS